jgi:hypothetical protein
MKVRKRRGTVVSPQQARLYVDLGERIAGFRFLVARLVWQ